MIQKTGIDKIYKRYKLWASKLRKKKLLEKAKHLEFRIKNPVASYREYQVHYLGYKNFRI